MARIAVAGFQHETNTFAADPATYADFETPDAWPGLARGAAIQEAVAGINLPIAGAIEALIGAGHEVVPLIWASAAPSAAVTKDAYDRVTGLLLQELADRGPVDGVYLDLHGAMVTESYDGGDGETLRRVREAAPKVPIVASLDLHANISSQMIDIANGLVAYRSYPHVDMAETGTRAVVHLLACLDGVQDARFLKRLPYLIPLPWQCTDMAPAHGLYRHLAELEIGPGISTLSFAMGFPPADVAHCGPTVFAYGRHQTAVTEAVEVLTGEIEAAEAGFAGQLWSPADAVSHALKLCKTGGGPVILADTQDNPGGGAASDGAELLAELVGQGAEGAVVGLLCDPEAAAMATQAGVGAHIDLALGGRAGVPGQRPFKGRFAVVALGDGTFPATGPFYRGSRMQLGQMALLEIEKVRVAVSSRKQQAADRAMFRHLGVEPAEANILALKSSVHFRADFAPLAKEILVVKAPGSNIADPAELPYRKLRAGVRLNPTGPKFKPRSQ